MIRLQIEVVREASREKRFHFFFVFSKHEHETHEGMQLIKRPRVELKTKDKDGSKFNGFLADVKAVFCNE